MFKKQVQILIATVFLFSTIQTQAAVVGMQPKFNFNLGYSTLYRKDYVTLESVAELHAKYPHAKVMVAGYTDSTGTDAVNAELGEARAASTHDLLVNYGVLGSLIQTQGFIDRMPVASNSSVEGRKKNRRVEILFHGLSDEEAAELNAKVRDSSHVDLITDPNRVEQILNGVAPSSTIAADTASAEGGQAWSQAAADANEIQQEDGAEVSSDETVALSDESSTADHKRFGLGLMVGPNWNSVYYEGGISTEFGDLNYFSVALQGEMRFWKRWMVSGYGYYLPSEVDPGSLSLGFLKSEFENNFYGLGLSYIVKENAKNHFRLGLGVNSHFLGGLEQTASTVQFVKFNHIAASIGAVYERRFGSKWALEGDLSYLVPISMSEVDDFSGKLWWRGVVALKRSLSENWNLRLEYQAVYHESEVTFDVGSKATPEFFTQSLLLGIKYQF